MFPLISRSLTSVLFILFYSSICICDLPPLPPSLALYSPGELEYTDVLVKKIGDNLTLVCELKSESAPRVYVWNYVSANGTSGDRPFTIEPGTPSWSSKLFKPELRLSDSGHYMCSSPPFSVTKYILVQSIGPKHCARGAFACGLRCVLASYVCDGRRDCFNGEDEAPTLCDERPCARADKLNCSSGRCISEAACCRGGATPLCRQPSCCDEHPQYSRLEGYVDIQYPALFDDRHAPDDYGFIQSTIYTVTACALIFMIAVVLLVSAICKMHMKRAALRSYAHAERATRQHYNMHYTQIQAHRFPPCYEASRLLQEGAVPSAAPATSPSPHTSPAHVTAQSSPNEGTSEQPCIEADTTEECRANGFGLARLSSIFTSRYRQVPTQCDVEMTDVRSSSLNSSPTRPRPTLNDYRSPTYCDLNATDFYFTSPDTSACARDLNYMSTPVEFFRRRTLRTTALERVIDHIQERQRPLTLNLGRFQLSIPRFGRRASTEPRPDTPNVAEINIDDLDFVRLNSNDTYTLNGRTIRLLGANFENYPVLNDGNVRPPPYNEAMRYKLCGPPPEYLSRDALNNEPVTSNTPSGTVDEQARSNVEMPPRYEDLASGVDANANVSNDNNDTGNGNEAAPVTDNAACNNTNVTENNVASTSTASGEIVNGLPATNIRSVIDNLPAIDSDVNANERPSNEATSDVPVHNGTTANSEFVNGNECT